MIKTLYRKIYNRVTSNLSDDLRKRRVFFNTKALTSIVCILSPYKSRLVNLTSEKFDICSMRLVILSKECSPCMSIKGTAQEIVIGRLDFSTTTTQWI